MAPVKGPFFILIVPMTMALNDHHSIVAAALAAIQVTVMLAISELGTRAAKPTVPRHIAVATNPNAELLGACYSRSYDRDRGERRA